MRGETVLNHSNVQSVHVSPVNANTIFMPNSLTPITYIGITKDHKVVTWGNGTYCRDIYAFESILTNVEKVYTNWTDVCIALKKDNSIIIWGEKVGKDVYKELNNIDEIQVTRSNYVFKDKDKNVFYLESILNESKESIPSVELVKSLFDK